MISKTKKGAYFDNPDLLKINNPCGGHKAPTRKISQFTDVEALASNCSKDRKTRFMESFFKTKEEKA